MSDFDNTNRGALFKNDRKEKDSHPDYTGNINVGGEEFWLSAWVKEKNGDKFFSMALKPKDEKAAKPAPKQEEPEDQDFPF